MNKTNLTKQTQKILALSVDILKFANKNVDVEKSIDRQLKKVNPQLQKRWKNAGKKLGKAFEFSKIEKFDPDVVKIAHATFKRFHSEIIKKTYWNAKERNYLVKTGKFLDQMVKETLKASKML